MDDKALLAFIYDRRLTPSLGILRLRLETCHEYAAEFGWEIAGEWVDEDEAALSDDHRPKFDLMVTKLRTVAGTGRRVVCLLNDWDRLSRSPGRRAEFLRQISTAGGYTVTSLGEDDRPDTVTQGRPRALRPAP